MKTRGAAWAADLLAHTHHLHFCRPGGSGHSDHYRGATPFPITRPLRALLVASGKLSHNAETKEGFPLEVT